VTAKDWLLVFIADDEVGEGIDPVRLQKGMFLLAREGGLPVRQRYRFIPYNYGPMSRGVYRDVGLLGDERLLVERPVPGYAWGRLAATEKGRARAAELRADAAVTPERLRMVGEIRAAVTRTTFADLLREIYRRYPEYAVRSVFERGEDA
jgi:uncharacterized protein YwgA